MQVLNKCVLSTSKIFLQLCEGCFCNGATWRAEGDHYVGLDSKRGVAEPKIQPRALNSAQGLMGYFQKVFFKNQGNKAQINKKKG
jgi:hypothetical protein